MELTQETKDRALTVLKDKGLTILPDNKQWELRFEIKSATSDSLYTVARHKTNHNWGCSCFGWIRYRKCKHLDAVSDLLESVDIVIKKSLGQS